MFFSRTSRNVVVISCSIRITGFKVLMSGDTISQLVVSCMHAFHKYVKWRDAKNANARATLLLELIVRRVQNIVMSPGFPFSEAVPSLNIFDYAFS